MSSSRTLQCIEDNNNNNDLYINIIIETLYISTNINKYNITPICIMYIN